MAYTFDELAKFFVGGPYPSAQATMVITQEDGRTSYGDGVINGYDQASETFFGQLNQLFNDRIDPRGPGTYDDQPFAKKSSDIVGLRIHRNSPNDFTVDLALQSWGNVLVTVTLEEANQAKMLMGWGETIGFGTGQALYVISFNAAAYSPG